LSDKKPAFTYLYFGNNALFLACGFHFGLAFRVRLISRLEVIDELLAVEILHGFPCIVCPAKPI
jgi:hypothetical protein